MENDQIIYFIQNDDSPFCGDIVSGTYGEFKKILGEEPSLESPETAFSDTYNGMNDLIDEYVCAA